MTGVMSASHESLSIIIDGSSVGDEHGMGVWSARGLEIAINYFKDRRHTVLAMISKHIENTARPDDRLIIAQIKELDSSMLWVHPGTSSMRSDMLEHAVDAAEEGHRVVLVSNHHFCREVDALHNSQYFDACRSFLNHCRVAFSFRGDSFQPQPLHSRIRL
jgi:hypothetical protein